MIRFDLHTLGWHDFEHLCHSITREVLGQAIEHFLPTNDAGRDGAFTGHTAGPSFPPGRYVIQCKHTVAPTGTLTPSDVDDEIAKAARLAADGRCDVYILMTNAGVSGTTAETLEDRLKAVCVDHFITFDRDWINQSIAEHPRLRMLVPRLYGLGDLTQILDERAYRQAEAIVYSMRSDLAKVVRTTTYDRAAEALDKHGFVLLLGEAAAGKTTIAIQLALSAIDALGASLIKVDEPTELADHWNPDEPSQLFWLDDVFGTTQFEVDLARSWARMSPRIQAAISSGARVVVTSRDYIFEAARPHLKPGAFPLLEESRVVVDVHDLSIIERKQILYNHLKHGDQPTRFLRAIVGKLDGLAERPSFSPELARRLASPTFTKNLKVSGDAGLNAFFDEPKAFLQDVIEGLDASSQAALGLIYLHQGMVPSPIEMTSADSDLVTRLGSDLGRVTASLQAMQGSIVAHRLVDGDAGWSFAHPTMTDVYEEMLRRHPELLMFYVRTAPLPSLLRTVTCGDVEVRGGLVLGHGLYPAMHSRLDEPVAGDTYNDTWHDRRSRVSFLTYRCDRAFRAERVARDPALFDAVSRPGLMLEAVPETTLALQLHEEGLLPEEHRAEFVSTVTDYFIDGEDGAALTNSSIRAVFNEAELDRIRERIRNELVPVAENAVDNWFESYEEQESPDDFARPLAELLSAAKEALGDDPEARSSLQWAENYLEEAAADTPYREYDGEQEDYGRSSSAEGPDAADEEAGRSIFDDLVAPEGR